MADAGCILVVDDDPSMREMLAEYLGLARVQRRRRAGRRRHARARSSASRRTSCCSTCGCRREDGLTLARYLREHYDIGIIMVTGSGEVVDRIVGLEVGADDYVTKPFDPRELLARVKSVMRRMHARPGPAPTQPARRCDSGRGTVVRVLRPLPARRRRAPAVRRRRS